LGNGGQKRRKGAGEGRMSLDGGYKIRKLAKRALKKVIDGGGKKKVRLENNKCVQTS